MKMFTDSWTNNDRVRAHTRPESNRQIDQKTHFNIERYRGKPPEVISRRIQELDREWDIERVLEANASVLALTGVILAGAFNRKWLLLSGTVLGFLFLHSTQGWCPPLPLLRARGVRTRGEIDEEKYALLELSTGSANR
jgi:hypothetical protein